MTVVDTSVFIDMLFRYDEKRYKLANRLFRLLQDVETTITEPEIFKVELIGQLVRRMNKNEAILLYEEIIERIEVVKIESLKEIAFSIAFETGCRAVDSFYVAVAKMKCLILISNDKVQVESAKKYGVEAYYLIEDFDRAVGRLKEIK